jgi:hypothetical protein
MEASKKLLELAQQQAQAEQATSQSGGNSAGQDDVVDADFKEVDDNKK